MQLTLSISIALFMWLLFCTGGACGQKQETLPSADQVLDAFYEALGGEMAIAGMSEVRFSGTYTGQMWSGDMEIKYKDGKYVFAYELEGIGPLRQGYDGDKWWRSMPGREVEELKGEDQAMARQFPFCTPQFLEWRDFEGTIEVVAGTEFRGSDVWHLKFSYDEQVVVDRFFDRESGLLVAASVESRHADATAIYEFEDFEGVLWASRIVSETKVSGAEEAHFTEIHFTEHDFDARLDDDEFAMTGTDSDN